MIISISEAARLAGRSRQTLYAMRDRGELSFTTADVSGTVGLDMAELCRVFPHIKPDNIGQHTVVNNEQQLTTASDSLVVRALQAQIDALERLLNEKDQRIMLLEDLREKAKPIESEKLKSEDAPKGESVPSKKRGVFDRVVAGIQAAIK